MWRGALLVGAHKQGQCSGVEEVRARDCGLNIGHHCRNPLLSNLVSRTSE